MDFIDHCMSRESNIPLSNALRNQKQFTLVQETATENKPVNTSAMLFLAAPLMSFFLVESCRSPVIPAIETLSWDFGYMMEEAMPQVLTWIRKNVTW